MKDDEKKFTALTTLVGAVIGAGILGIPYVVSQSGFIFGVTNMIIIAIAMIILALYLGEIALRTKNDHQLTGYAQKYLGKKGKVIMLIALIFGIYSALLAYLTGEGESLSYLFFQNLHFVLIFGIAFWIILAALSYHGLKMLQKSEKIGVVLLIAMVALIALVYGIKINPANLTYHVTKNIFAPFGVILFAFLGFAIIPEVAKILAKQRRSVKKTIIGSYLLIFVVYFIFTAIVLGYKGANTPQIATLTLGAPFIAMGILAMFNAYLAHTNALIEMLRLDFRLRKIYAWAIVNLIPLVLFIILTSYKIAAFDLILGIGGTISGGLTAILILFMVKNAKKKGDRKPEYSIPYSRVLAWILILIFTIGTILELVKLF